MAEEQKFSKRRKVLLSDTGPLLFSVRESILQTSQVSPLIATNNQEIMALVRLWQPDLMILGPDDIASICQTLKSSKTSRDIPLVAIIENNDQRIREEALSAGCDEWLPTPIDEMELLNKVQDLIGLRFRKLPRYSHNAAALVSFKGKDFPSRSVDINRRMIFLESNEGLAPATGRNVQLQFQLTKEEPITCWGRVVRLMARRSPTEEKETIGMLIRFLDLPRSAERRIDTLAIRQYENARLPEEKAADQEFTWFETDYYQSLLSQLHKGQASDLTDKLEIPPAVLQSYLQSLSEEEQETIRDPKKLPLLSRTIAARVQMMDELNKFHHGAPLNHASQTLITATHLLAQVQAPLDQAIQQDDQKAILMWSNIKSEIIRTKVEVDSMLRKDSTFAKTLTFAAKEEAPRRKQLGFVVLAILLIFSLFLNFKLLKPGPQIHQSIAVSKLGEEGRYLRSGHMLQPGYGDWAVFHGNLDESWGKLNAGERQAYCLALKEKLKSQGVRQIFLFGPGGSLNAAVINDEIQILK